MLVDSIWRCVVIYAALAVPDLVFMLISHYLIIARRPRLIPKLDVVDLTASFALFSSILEVLVEYLLFLALSLALPVTLVLLNAFEVFGVE